MLGWRRYRKVVNNGQVSFIKLCRCYCCWWPILRPAPIFLSGDRFFLASWIQTLHRFVDVRILFPGHWSSVCFWLSFCISTWFPRTPGLESQKSWCRKKPRQGCWPIHPFSRLLKFKNNSTFNKREPLSVCLCRQEIFYFFSWSFSIKKWSKKTMFYSDGGLGP